MILRNLLLLLLTSLGALPVYSQYSSFRNIEKFKLGQLIKNDDSSGSNTIDPVIDFSQARELNKNIFLLPVAITHKYSSHHNYGWNDASLLPESGDQVLLETGLGIRAGKHFSIILAPELLITSNHQTEGFTSEHDPKTWASYYHWLNTIDLPENFGTKRTASILPGQSGIYYSAGNISLGVSTSNLWWGPGNKNALVMTNSAPGFLHFSLKTNKPLKTGIGTFEGEMINGLLENSGFTPPETNRAFNGRFLYEAKTEASRYITGIVLTWQPKWLRNFYIGLAKSSYLYFPNIRSPLDVLPLQGFLGGALTKSERYGEKASMGSLFARYVIPTEKLEMYFEYGRADRALMPWGIVEDHAFRRGYIAGFRKVFRTAHRNQYFQVFGELTQLEMPTRELINYMGSWYTHTQVRQGYTHKGQLIGSGIGPGSNVQTIEFSWLKGKNKIGIEVERLNHNNDFYFNAFEYIGDFRRQWVDIASHLNLNRTFNKIQLNASIGLIRSLNYQWYVFDQLTDPNLYFKSGYDVLNFEAKLTATYKF